MAARRHSTQNSSPITQAAPISSSAMSTSSASSQPRKKSSTYCACWLDSDADKDVEIRVGSDDGYKLWINHKLIATVHEYRAMEMDQETHKVKLNKGKNLLLIKVDQDTGEYQFMLRVVGSDGKATPGVTVWN